LPGSIIYLAADASEFKTGGEELRDSL
jgi:hypothetical protein